MAEKGEYVPWLFSLAKMASIIYWLFLASVLS